MDPGHFDSQLGGPESYFSRYQLHLFHSTAEKAQKYRGGELSIPWKEPEPLLLSTLSAFAVPTQAD